MAFLVVLTARSISARTMGSFVRLTVRNQLSGAILNKRYGKRVPPQRCRITPSVGADLTASAPVTKGRANIPAGGT
jgi:hypothetical protein